MLRILFLSIRIWNFSNGVTNVTSVSGLFILDCPYVSCVTNVTSVSGLFILDCPYVSCVTNVNEQSRDTGNIGHTRHTTKKNKTQKHSTTQKAKKMSNTDQSFVATVLFICP
jgi:hypothetical protein